MSTSISSERPTSARAERSAWRVPSTSPIAAALTGFDFPFTMNGARSVVRKSVCDCATTSVVASTCPGAALPITRAARLMASPLTENVRRNEGPKSPANT